MQTMSFKHWPFRMTKFAGLERIPKLSVAAGILPAVEGVHLAARSNACNEEAAF